MQEPLIKSVLTEGAIFPQQCCPSPYHAYPAALGIEIPDDKKGNIDFIVDEIGKKIKEKGASGKFSTWPVPVNMLFVEAGTEYAMAYIEGKTNGKNDKEKLSEILNSKIDGKITITPYTDNCTKKTYDNYYLLLSDYIDF